MRLVPLLAAIALGCAGPAAAQSPPTTGAGDMASPEPLPHRMDTGATGSQAPAGTGAPYPSPLPGGTGTSNGSAARAPMPAPFAYPAPVPAGNVEATTVR